MKKVIVMLLALVFALSMTACSSTDSGSTDGGSGGEGTAQSQLYTDEDIAALTDMATKEVQGWKGCEVQDVSYAGDECNTDDNIKWLNSLEEGKNYTQCAEILVDFHSPTEEADLEGTAWEPDKDYTDYQFWFARADGGDWELVSNGY